MFGLPLEPASEVLRLFALPHHRLRNAIKRLFDAADRTCTVCTVRLSVPANPPRMEEVASLATSAGRPTPPHMPIHNMVTANDEL